MRFILSVVIVSVFVGIPLYLLNTFVMPELNSMQQFYAREDTIANNVAQVHH